MVKNTLALQSVEMELRGKSNGRVYFKMTDSPAALGPSAVMVRLLGVCFSFTCWLLRAVKLLKHSENSLLHCTFLYLLVELLFIVIVTNSCYCHYLPIWALKRWISPTMSLMSMEITLPASNSVRPHSSHDELLFVLPSVKPLELLSSCWTQQKLHICATEHKFAVFSHCSSGLL